MQLPEKFIRSLEHLSGFDREAFEKAHDDAHPLVSVRLNPRKLTRPSPALEVDSPVPWSAAGYYLSRRPSFTLDPLFHGGGYYPQEASSMFLEQALSQTVDLGKPLRLLDLCAAPGGKSTLIQSLACRDSLLVSNEAIRSRAAILVENITKWGAGNVVVTNNDPRQFSGIQDFFDVVVVDAPCSGSGLFRKDPDAIEEWSEENVLLCNRRQQRILADILPALKPEGILVYSTCSYSEQENEQILDWLVGRYQMESLRLALEEHWLIQETESKSHRAWGYRFYPHRTKGEGFFIAVLRKTGNLAQGLAKGPKPFFEKLSRKEEDIAKKWTTGSQDRQLFKNENRVFSLPEDRTGDLHWLKNFLYIKKAGVELGRLAGNDLIPSHDLALSDLVSETLGSCRLSMQQALSYLRKEPLSLETSISGWALVSYENMHLGWVKVLKDRINNYYPPPWRIRI